MTQHSVSPAVSLIIPSYNRGDRILHTLESALVQTQPFAEILVVNDGGCLETIEAVASLGESLVRLLSIPQSGAPAARNAGATAAVNPILMLLDDDDRLRPYTNEVLLRALLAFPQSKAAFCDHSFLDQVTGEYLPNHFHRLPQYARFRSLVPERQAADSAMLFGRNLHDVLLEGNLLGQPWMVWKDTYLELGGFRPNLGSADDWDVYLRLTRRYKVSIIDRVASDHFREVGRTHLTTGTGQQERQMQVARDQLKLAGWGDWTAQRVLRRKLGLQHKALGDSSRDIAPAVARRHYLASLRWWPFDPVVALRALYPKF